MRLKAPIAALLLLAACDTTASLKTLRTAPLSGSEFKIELARHYLAYAEQEMAAYDWWTSKYFADKGLMAAYGQDVQPEQIDNWTIPKAKREELQSAYRALIEKLTPEFKQADPKRAGELQFSFDCWMEEQDDGWKTDAIAKCRNRFYALLEGAASSAAVPPAIHHETPKPKATQKPRPLLIPILPTTPPSASEVKAKPEASSLESSYLIHFGWDENTVDGMARDELEAIAAALKASPQMHIVINGHADRSGSDEYNMQLSQRRADFIRDFLMQQGVAKDNIGYYAFGESDPLVQTADGKRAAENRRVELDIE